MRSIVKPEICKGVFDKYGFQVHEGDIVIQGHPGKVIWSGDGEIVECPVGIVRIGDLKIKMPVFGSDDDPEITERYNVIQIRPGIVKLNPDTKKEFLKQYEKDGEWYSSLHLSKYDGDFYGWDDITIIGSIYDIPSFEKTIKKNIEEDNDEKA